MSRSSRVLLIGAVLATPLFVALWAAQAFSREGFRPAFHPMSLLSLGDLGWAQIVNFLVTGALVIGGGAALARTLDAGHLTRWASISIALMGAGLLVAGVFVTDAGAGFPPGAPEGAPAMSWHGAVHEVGFLLTQLAFLAVTVLLAVRFGRSRQRGWMTASIAALVLAVLIAAVGDPETLAIRLVLSAAVELGFISVLAYGALRRRVR